MEYCEMNMYVKEGLLANPHKYGEKDKSVLREHIKTCEICQTSVEEARHFAKMMDWEFEI